MRKGRTARKSRQQRAYARLAAHMVSVHGWGFEWLDESMDREMAHEANVACFASKKEHDV